MLTGMTDEQLFEHWRNVPVMKPGDKRPWETFDDDLDYDRPDDGA